MRRSPGLESQWCILSCLRSRTLGAPNPVAGQKIKQQRHTMILRFHTVLTTSDNFHQDILARSPLLYHVVRSRVTLDLRTHLFGGLDLRGGTHRPRTRYGVPVTINFHFRVSLYALTKHYSLILQMKYTNTLWIIDITKQAHYSYAFCVDRRALSMTWRYGSWQCLCAFKMDRIF